MRPNYWTHDFAKKRWKTHVFLYFISPLAQAPRPTITGAREAGSQESWKVIIYLIF